METDNVRGYFSSISLRLGSEPPNVAVFVDVENMLGFLKRGGGKMLLAQASELGIVAIRRAYGDFSNPTVSARQEELQRHGFDMVHTLHPAKAKSNSADICMTIDVMEYVCRTAALRWVVLATGDSDFSPLFRKLRELGMGVVGVGPSSVLSDSVTLSCHAYLLTDSNRGLKPLCCSGGGGICKRNDGGSRQQNGSCTRCSLGKQWPPQAIPRAACSAHGGHPPPVPFRGCPLPPVMGGVKLGKEGASLPRKASSEGATPQWSPQSTPWPTSPLDPPQLSSCQGPLSVVRPSQKLYGHLLAWAGARWANQARDWGEGLTELMLIDALLCLSACSGGGSAHTQAVATLAGAAAATAGDGKRGTTEDGGRGEEGMSCATGQHGLEREQACRVVWLLRRCGFLPRYAGGSEAMGGIGGGDGEFGQWRVLLPANIDILRRRRDGVVLTELLRRCQEAGVNFDPMPALPLLWSARSRGGGMGVLGDPGVALEWVANLVRDVADACTLSSPQLAFDSRPPPLPSPQPLPCFKP
ncbi:unnamed protein product [Discosporangium mesarthrocarpum]